jgi:hypothetical protein
MNTATITGLDLADDGVFLVRATCDRCRKTVLHGAGRDADNLILGSRVSHCGCPDVYELVDPKGIVGLRLHVIAEGLAEKARRRAEARTRRDAATPSGD